MARSPELRSRSNGGCHGEQGPEQPKGLRVDFHGLGLVDKIGEHLSEKEI